MFPSTAYMFVMQGSFMLALLSVFSQEHPAASDLLLLAGDYQSARAILHAASGQGRSESRFSCASWLDGRDRVALLPDQRGICITHEFQLPRCWPDIHCQCDRVRGTEAW